MAESMGAADATPKTISEVSTPVAMDFLIKQEDGGPKKKVKLSLTM
jgi:hypothetical protein